MKSDHSRPMPCRFRGDQRGCTNTSAARSGVRLLRATTRGVRAWAAMKKVHGSSLLAELDLNLLYVFHVVYREKSVRQAAAILSVSQSAVSHAIGRLRMRLGASLFEQQGRGLVPTPMADRLAPDVSAALMRLEG